MGKHHKHGPATVTTDANGDVTNMRGTVNEASPTRPYAPMPDQKEAKK